MPSELSIPPNNQPINTAPPSAPFALWFTQVKNALDELRKGVTASSITGLISAGTGINLTGSGTQSSPYQISSTATGTVTSVSVTPANGVSGTVNNPTTTPAISLALGAITPTSVNGATAAEVGRLSGVTSPLQAQLDAKQNNLTLTTAGTSGAATLVGATLNIPAYQTGSNSTTNYINNIRIDQSGTATAPYGALTGAVNGTNTAYTTSAPYASGTLVVYRNGVELFAGQFSETSPAAGTFTVSVAPQSGTDTLVAAYTTQTTTTGSLPEAYTIVTGTYTQNGSTDNNIIGNTTSGVVTVNLPSAVTFDGKRYKYKNIATGASLGALMRLVPVSGQTVDGSATRSLIINDGVQLLAVNGNWQVMLSYYPATTRDLYSQITQKAGDTLQANEGVANEYRYFPSGVDLPPLSLVPGVTIEFEFAGNFNTTALGPSTLARVALNTTAVVQTGALSLPLGVTNYTYSGKASIEVLTSGAAGTVKAYGILNFQDQGSGQLVSIGVPIRTATVDTTIAQRLQLGAAFTNTTTGNNNTLQFLKISETRPPKAAN